MLRPSVRRGKPVAVIIEQGVLGASTSCLGRGMGESILTLLALAAGALLLPHGWTRRLISLVQVLVPLQHAATTVTDSVARAMEGDAPPVPADTYEALQREKLALEHRMASLELRVAELEDENTLLTATRLSEVDGWRIGARGRLIPARVIAKDVLGWRSSALIDAGSLQGVQPGSAVASHLFEVDQGKTAGVRSGMAILRGEVLIGLVEQVGTHTARVKLLSDVSVESKVRIGRFTESGFQAVRSSFWVALGMTSSRNRSTRSRVCSAAGPVAGMALKTAVVPALSTCAGVTSLTPLVLATSR